MLPAYEPHVTPDQYRHNLISIITHPIVQAQRPRILLITPPPVDEYALADSGMGGSRTAERTRLYADITVGVGEELGVAVLDIWTYLMEKSGWQPGSPLNGSLTVPRSWAFSQFFVDGESLSVSRKNLIAADGAVPHLPGLHFSPTAYRFLYDGVMSVIQSKWPDQIPEISPQASDRNIGGIL
jgi:isoamyl acetate esterase